MKVKLWWLVIEVGNVAVVTSTCLDESESVCLTRTKYFCNSGEVLTGAAGDPDDGRSDESGGGHPGSGGDGDRGGCVN